MSNKIKMNNPQRKSGAFSELYYREKAMAIQSASLVLGVRPEDVPEEAQESYKRAFVDSMKMFEMTISPFVRELSADEANAALGLVGDK